MAQEPRLLGYVAVDTSVPLNEENLKQLQYLEGLRQKGLLKDPSLIGQWQQLYVRYQNHLSRQQPQIPVTRENSSSAPASPAPVPAPATPKPDKSQVIEEKAPNLVPPPKDTSVTITVNGVQFNPTVTDVTMSLLTFIRSLPAHKGTKRGCNEGGCGVCTVMLSTSSTIPGISVNSCLRPLVACDGMYVTTIEGIGSEKNGLHPLQQRLAEHDGTQCGFCSTGMVMNMYSFLANNSNASAAQIEKNLDGNICRCTGYRPILDAFKSFAPDNEPSTAKRRCAGICGKKCSKDGEKHEEEHGGQECTNSCKLSKMYPDIEDLHVPKYDTNVAIKHLDLVNHQGKATENTSEKKSGHFADGDSQWLVPADLNSLYNYMKANSAYSLVFGHTSAGIYKNWNSPVFLDLSKITDLQGYNIVWNQNQVVFGSCITITTFLALLIEFNASNQFTNDQKIIFPDLIYLVNRVAHVHVRNAGSIGGNLMLTNKHSFQSDLCIALMGLGASVWVGFPDVPTVGQNSTSTKLSSNGIPNENPNVVPVPGGGEIVPLENFVNYDMTGKVLRSVIVPMGRPNMVYHTQKVSARNVNAKSIVNAGFSAIVKSGVIQEQPIFAFGNVRTKQMRAKVTEQWIVGKNLSDNAVLTQALKILQQELQPDPSIPDKEYRGGVALAFFYKFYLSLLPNLPPVLQSAVQRFERPVSSGQQSFQSDPSEFPVSAPIHKLKGAQQCSGEVQYTDDSTVGYGILHAAFSLTNVANADITSVDPSAALAMDGVVGWISAQDIPGTNFAGNMPFIATTKSQYAGQAVGIIVAKSQAIADAAATKVVVKYANQKTPLITVEDALAANSFFNISLPPVQVGDVNQGLKESDYVINGTVKNGGQYHYHIETQTCFGTVGEDGDIVLNAATQDVTGVIQAVSGMLNLSKNKVSVKVRRCGGGYGGKLSNSTFPACAVSLATKKFGLPVSIVMNLETNMRMLGMRPDVYSTYTVGVKKDGTLKALQLSTYINGGIAVGDATFTAQSFLATSYGPYNFPNFSCTVKIAQTNIAATTSVRGPGWTPGCFCIEHIMEHVANFLNTPVADFKRKSFFQKGQTTPDGFKLDNWNLDTIFDQLRSVSDYDNRLKAIQSYNNSNAWTKKGLSFVPLRWAAGWAGERFSSMVSILSDGSVLAGHGGVEIGQGIDTKVSQTVAYKLGISMDLINIVPHRSTESPETSGTGGSVTSELCCAAAIDACNQLNQKLQPIREKLKNPSWTDLINAAYQQGVNLSVIGFISVPNGPTTYQSYSSAVQEVFVDLLTGEHQLLRTDILFDAGISLNPAIDIGQVEGGFVMGVGLFTHEEVTYDPSNGQLQNYNTWTYKPPSYADIPIDFRVNLLKNAPNPVGILASKVVGEPPVALACASIIGIQQAVISAKQALGQNTQNFGLNAPATPENVFNSAGLFPIISKQ